MQLNQYGGGPEEGQIIGNRNGYRRLGIEFLKASLHETDEGFTVDLKYLVSPDSTIRFDWFELSNTMPSTKSEQTWSERMILIGCFIIFAIALFIFVVGLCTVFQWVVT